MTTQLETELTTIAYIIVALDSVAIQIEGELLNPPAHLQSPTGSYSEPSAATASPSSTRMSCYFDQIALQLPPEVHAKGSMFEWSRQTNTGTVYTFLLAT